MSSDSPRMRSLAALLQRGNDSEDNLGVKTTRITVETETLTIIRRAGLTMAWCPSCGKEVEVVNLEHDRFARFSAAQLRDWIVTGKLHLLCDAPSPTQVCLPSLLHCFESPDVRENQGINRRLNIKGEAK